MNHHRLLENKCYGGGTAIVLRIDEYRLSPDVRNTTGSPVTRRREYDCPTNPIAIRVWAINFNGGNRC
jgi:hypothetical protein